MKYLFPSTVVFKVALFILLSYCQGGEQAANTMLNERYMNHKIAAEALMYLFESSGFSSEVWVRTLAILVFG